MAKANVWIGANDRDVYTDGSRDGRGGYIEWVGWSGDTWTFNAVPNEGYSFDHWDWTVSGGPNDGSSDPNVNGLTISGSGQYEKKIGDGQSGYSIKIDAYFISYGGGGGGEDGPDEKHYTLTTYVSPNSKCGAVSPSGTNRYKEGTTVTVSATETDSAYQFDHFVVDGSRRDSRTVSVTMDHDHTVVAVFSLKYHGILFSPSAGGAILCDQSGNILCI